MRGWSTDARPSEVVCVLMTGRAHLGRCNSILPAICHGLQHMLAREAQRAQAMKDGAVKACTLRELLVYVQGVVVAAEPVQGCCTARQLISAPRPCCVMAAKVAGGADLELKPAMQRWERRGVPARDALLCHSVWLAIWRLVGSHSTRTPPAHCHALVCIVSEGLQPSAAGMARTGAPTGSAAEKLRLRLSSSLLCPG